MLITRGWVLAGGLASRFGSDKAVFPVDGVPMVLRVADTLAAAGLDVGVVARVPRGLPLRELIEPDGPRHPLWGVAAALVEGDAFFAPCDLPDLDVATVRRLLAAGAVAAECPLLGVVPAANRQLCRTLALEGRPVGALPLPRLSVGPLSDWNRPPVRS